MGRGWRYSNGTPSDSDALGFVAWYASSWSRWYDRLSRCCQSWDASRVGPTNDSPNWDSKVWRWASRCCRRWSYILTTSRQLNCRQSTTWKCLGSVRKTCWKYCGKCSGFSLGCWWGATWRTSSRNRAIGWGRGPDRWCTCRRRATSRRTSRGTSWGTSRGTSWRTSRRATGGNCWWTSGWTCGRGTSRRWMKVLMIIVYIFNI